MRAGSGSCVRVTLFLGLAALLLGCKTGMKMSGEELRKVGADEGLVLGSIRIFGGDDVLGRKAWDILVEKRGQSMFSTSSDYVLGARRDQDEEVFLTKMPAGEYHFYKLVQPGFSSFEAEIDVPFEVLAGKTVYVGRLVIEFPEGLITTGSGFRVRVEDARSACVQRAENEYGLPLADAVTQLATGP